jgi:hypothetical protein
MQKWHGSRETHQETPDQGQSGTRNLERMEAQGKQADASRRQKGSEGPRWWMAVISEETRPEETKTGKHGKC